MKWDRSTTSLLFLLGFLQTFVQANSDCDIYCPGYCNGSGQDCSVSCNGYGDCWCNCSPTGGVIAGIVIACLIVFCFILTCVILLVRRNRYRYRGQILTPGVPVGSVGPTEMVYMATPAAYPQPVGSPTNADGVPYAYGQPVYAQPVQYHSASMPAATSPVNAFPAQPNPAYPQPSSPPDSFEPPEKGHVAQQPPAYHL